MPAKPMLVLSADWHLALGAWAQYPAIRGDAYYALQQIEDYCVDVGLDHYAAGDLFDSYAPDSRSVGEVLNQKRRDGLMNLNYIQGDHDCREVPWLSVSGNPLVTYLSCRLVQLPNGATLYGLDYRKPVELEKAMADHQLAKADVLLCHQKWREFLGPWAEGGLSLEMCPNKHIWTGDYHGHQTIQHFGKTVLSPGSICAQAVDESPNKFFFVVNDDLTTTSVELRSRYIYRFILEDNDALEDLLTMANIARRHEGVPENIAMSIVEVGYYADLNKAAERLEAHFNDVHLMLTRLPRLKKAAVEAAPAPDLPTAVKQVVPAEAPFRDELVELLACPQDQQRRVLGEQRQKFFTEAARG